MLLKGPRLPGLARGTGMLGVAFPCGKRHFFVPTQSETDRPDPPHGQQRRSRRGFRSARKKAISPGEEMSLFAAQGPLLHSAANDKQ